RRPPSRTATRRRIACERSRSPKGRAGTLSAAPSRAEARSARRWWRCCAPGRAQSGRRWRRRSWRHGRTVDAWPWVVFPPSLFPTLAILARTLWPVGARLSGVGLMLDEMDHSSLRRKCSYAPRSLLAPSLTTAASSGGILVRADVVSFATHAIAAGAFSLV